MASRWIDPAEVIRGPNSAGYHKPAFSTLDARQVQPGAVFWDR